MNDQFTFRKTDKVGVADAAEDDDFLSKNFIDTGDYSAIAEFRGVERFILGGAGIGKTAIISRLLQQKENVIVISPDALSMSYISSSNIISYLTDLNVNFELFYRMLWRHVLVIEVLKNHFGIDDENAKLTTFDKLRLRFERDPKKRAHLKSLEYLNKWGPNFWQTTNLRVKQIKDNFENKIEAKLGTDLSGLMGALGSSGSVSKEVLSEVTHSVQEVISSVQMKELSDLIKLIDDAIDDPQKQYFVVIDKLDENWVDVNIRYHLIKALLITVKDFAQAKQVKPIVVLRNDLINRVFDQTKEAGGFQEEKFSSLYLDVSWSEDQLLEMLDRRVKSLVKSRYTKQEVALKDVLPDVVKGVPINKYFVDRSLMRPRYMIELFNECIKQAVNSPLIDEEMLLLAEREFSRSRRTAVHDEWRSVYPSLEHWDRLLDNSNSEFFIEDVSSEHVGTLIDTYNLEKYDALHDRMAESVTLYLSNSSDAMANFKKDLLIMFYSCGYIGINSNDGVDYWAYGTRKLLKSSEIQDETVIMVNKSFNFAFNVRNIDR